MNDATMTDGQVATWTHFQRIARENGSAITHSFEGGRLFICEDDGEAPLEWIVYPDGYAELL